MKSTDWLIDENNAIGWRRMCVQISFVDYLLFDLLDNHVILTSTALDGFPALKGFYDRIAARPAIHQYRQTEAHLKRPVNGNGKQ